MLDTVEVSAVWSDLLGVYEAVRAALSLTTNEVRGHFSHVYPIGAALYFTFVLRKDSDAAVEDVVPRNVGQSGSRVSERRRQHRPPPRNRPAQASLARTRDYSRRRRGTPPVEERTRPGRAFSTQGYSPNGTGVAGCARATNPADATAQV